MPGPGPHLAPACLTARNRTPVSHWALGRAGIHRWRALGVAGIVIAGIAVLPISGGSPVAASIADSHATHLEPSERPIPGNVSQTNNSQLNNTTNRIGSAIASFAHWFAIGLVTVIALVVAVLLIGGIVNYVLVGRKRGEWTPSDSVRLLPPTPPPDRPDPPPPPPGGAAP